MSAEHGYKQTDIGEIPEDWDVVSLGELLQEVSIKARNLKTDIRRIAYFVNDSLQRLNTTS